MTSIADQKTAARRTARNRRRHAAKEHCATAPIEVINHLQNPVFASMLTKPLVIGGIWPLKNEIDPRPLMQSLHAQGYTLSLPCTPTVGQPLTFRAWSPGDALKEGPYDTREPFPDKAEVLPTLVLVPMLAFTMTGKRLGYGGGFYDRTLATLKSRHDVFACGIAYAAQEAPDLPTDEFDHRLDGILTEQYFKAF
ncbi:5-formyltetrahydrofolate cyclo-ligase [Litorimonas sp. RW-G-Af-16]|uniref:5-formyltetrahydrofolate cyclo-ligase n=1 Tax=Litorimonas sp. RW-G-Af-16 TaxID=3241168 RepID=UPI00390CA4E8